MKKNKFLALLFIAFAAIFVIAPANVNAFSTSEQRILTVSNTETGAYTESAPGFFSVTSSTLSAGNTSASVTVDDVVYTNNGSKGTIKDIGFSVPAGKIATVYMIALANSASTSTVNLAVSGQVIASTLPGYETTSTSVLVTTGLTGGMYNITSSTTSVLIFKITVVYVAAPTVDGGSQTSTDGTAVRLIGRIASNYGYEDFAGCGFYITRSSVTKTFPCTIVYSSLTEITGVVDSYTSEAGYYYFACTFTGITSSTTISVQPYVTLSNGSIVTGTSADVSITVL